MAAGLSRGGSDGVPVEELPEVVFPDEPLEEENAVGSGLGVVVALGGTVKGVVAGGLE